MSVEEELVMGGDADVEEEVVVFGGEGFGLNEEFCYQLVRSFFFFFFFSLPFVIIISFLIFFSSK